MDEINSIEFMKIKNAQTIKTTAVGTFQMWRATKIAIIVVKSIVAVTAIPYALAKLDECLNSITRSTVAMHKSQFADGMKT
jgi:hypothetical protein